MDVNTRMNPPPPDTRRGRGGTPWLRVQRQVYEEETHCWQCGKWVDQSLYKDHPLSRTVDHVHELHRGGDPLDRSNLRLAHRRCNTARSNRLRGKKHAKPQLSVDIDSI